MFKAYERFREDVKQGKRQGEVRDIITGQGRTDLKNMPINK